MATKASGLENLDLFFAIEFKEFNKKFEKHVQQLDLCLKEMDRFEKGAVFLEPNECSKFNSMRSVTVSLLEEMKVVKESYINWLVTITNENATKHSSTASEITNALIQIYYTKFQKAQIQSKRVRRQEKELIIEINELSESLKKLNPKENNGQSSTQPTP